MEIIVGAIAGNLVDLFAASYKEVNPNGKLAPLFSNSNRNKLKYDASDDAVISYLHEQASAAIGERKAVEVEWQADSSI